MAAACTSGLRSSVMLDLTAKEGVRSRPRKPTSAAFSCGGTVVKHGRYSCELLDIRRRCLARRDAPRQEHGCCAFHDPPRQAAGAPLNQPPDRVQAPVHARDVHRLAGARLPERARLDRQIGHAPERWSRSRRAERLLHYKERLAHHGVVGGKRHRHARLRLLRRHHLKDDHDVQDLRSRGRPRWRSTMNAAR